MIYIYIFTYIYIYIYISIYYTYLHGQSNHPKALKDSISYSQVLRIKATCLTTSEFILTQNRISVSITYSRYLPNISNIITKY